MGNIDDAVPFFGKGFNKIYPLIMVIYTLLVAFNFFGRIFEFFGSWKRFKIEQEADDLVDGFDPSGMIILQKERTWLEQGCKVGEQVVPLARYFNNANVDLESGNAAMETNELKSVVTPPKEDLRRGALTSQKEESRKYGNSREAIANKYAVKKQSNPVSIEPSPNSVSLLEPNLSEDQSQNNTNIGPANGLASTWANMKFGFQNFKANMNSRKFLPLRQMEPGPTNHTRASSSESLDEIFKRLNKRPNDGNDDFELDHDTP